MYTAINITSVLPSFNSNSDFQVESLTADNQVALLQNAMNNFLDTKDFPLVQVEMWNPVGPTTTRAAWFIGYNDNTYTTEGVHRICANFLVKIGESYILARSKTLSLDEFKWARFNSDPTVISGDLLDRVLMDEYTIVDAEKISAKVREILTLANNI